MFSLKYVGELDSRGRPVLFVPCIKALREATGAGLQEAKEAIEDIGTASPSELPFDFSPMPTATGIKELAKLGVIASEYDPVGIHVKNAIAAAVEAGQYVKARELIDVLLDQTHYPAMG